MPSTPGKLNSETCTSNRGSGEPPAITPVKPEALQQRHQRRLHFDDDVAAALVEQSHVADEVQRVAQPLFGMDQQRAARQRRAVPARRVEAAALVVLALEPPLVVLPAGREIALAQLHERAIVVGLGDSRA